MSTKPKKAAVKREAEAITVQPGVARELGLGQYAVIVALFTVFCLGQMMIMGMLMREFAGMMFFFGFLIVAFVVVAAIDYICSRCLEPDHQDA